MLAVAAPGCGPSVVAEQARWKLVAPAKVPTGGTLRFTIECRGPEGDVRGMEVRYVVDWVGLRGMKHKVDTFKEESIKVKGAPGTAVITVYAEDSAGNETPVAKQDVTVE